MEEQAKREVTETRTVITGSTVPKAQTTNINVRPDGGADVQVNEGEPVVEERTTVTTRRAIRDI